MKVEDPEKPVGWRQIPRRQAVHFFERTPYPFVVAVCGQCRGYAEPQLRPVLGAHKCPLCIMELLMKQPPFQRYERWSERNEERRRRYKLLQEGKLTLPELEG